MNRNSGTPRDQIQTVEGRTVDELEADTQNLMDLNDQPGRRPDDDPTLSQSIQNHLGRRLKATYDDLVRQPVPDKFRQLLEELERREKER